jgi:predicted pyridoxine 5'-phosphate oxidase superfamily flavin-nucleotide-binding protein
MATVDKTTIGNRLAETFGLPKDTTAAKVLPYMTEYVQEFICNAPFAVMATSDAQGQPDASPKGGKPGFVRVIDDRHLLFPDVAGNKLFQSYLNVEANPSIGLLFMIPGVNDTVRVNGKVIIVDKDELDRRNIELSLYEYDDNSKHIQGMLIEVVESYPHCPRAFKFSNIWDAEEIKANQANRPIRERG